ncbi:alpha-aminoadipic semialdehyde synthase [Iris pallida]|uniref:Alpha-aminoadipic semialdehyde synthase n=1 Tax=Iris pallida TaxID=29817 RepID=A0AAX6FLK9_IRIPA|nr:alpha-aminoadipic semialdehyde synthase [Iris pallida]
MILYTFSISRFILYVFSLAAAKAAIIVVGEEISTLDFHMELLMLSLYSEDGK